MEPPVIHALTGVLAVLLGGLTVVIPIAGLTMRFALRPLVQAWIEIKERQIPDRRSEILERRIDLLEAELQQMHHVVVTLQEGEDFNRRLQDGGQTTTSSAPRQTVTAE